MSDPAHVKVIVNALGRGSVEIDGVKVPNVRAVTVSSRARELTVVTLELVNVEVEVDAEARVVVH